MPHGLPAHTAPRDSDLEEQQELRKLLVAADLTEAHEADLTRNGVGTIVRLLNVGGGKLRADPPDAATLKAILNSCNSGSAAADADELWPKESEGAERMVLVGRFTALLRFCKRGLEAAEERVMRAVGASSGAGGSDAVQKDKLTEALKNSGEKARAIIGDAEALYHTVFARARATDPDVIIKTQHEMASGGVKFAGLASGKYGHTSSLFKSDKSLVVDGQSVAMGTDTPADLRKSAQVLAVIDGVLQTWVVASGEVDPAKQHMAGAYGTIMQGTAGGARPSQPRDHVPTRASRVRCTEGEAPLAAAGGHTRLRSAESVTHVPYRHMCLWNGQPAVPGGTDPPQRTAPQP